jgi:hypothetical protein
MCIRAGDWRAFVPCGIIFRNAGGADAPRFLDKTDRASRGILQCRTPIWWVTPRPYAPWPGLQALLGRCD